MTDHALKSIELSLREILSYSTLFADRHLTVDVILNPRAGAVSPGSRLDRAVESLTGFTRGLIGVPRDPNLLDV
ncbi:MAG: hypothetical protein V3S41_05665, partial [Spirochaetia bacterium]